MSKKSRSIKSAPKYVQKMAEQFRVKQGPFTIETKEISSELIKEVFADQFADAEHDKGKRIVWMEYLVPSPELKEKNQNMDIFIRSTCSEPDKVIAYFQSQADKLEYWVRKKTKHPSFKEKGLVIPDSVLAKAAIDEVE